MSDGKGDVWVEAGFAELARSGIEGVRVEVLAKNLGVTKGGFYRRFRDRGALLEGMLEDWREGRIAAIEQQASLEGESARERLAALIHLCGAGPALAYARRHFQMMAGERCGDHLVAGYVAKVNAMKRQFLRLAAGGGD